MRCLYYTGQYGVKTVRYKEMINLLNSYEKNFDLLPETYANSAIALSNQYGEYGLKIDRDACLDACEKSISKLPDYGLAYAIKLEVLLMDYEKAYDDNEREISIASIKRTLKSISSNSSIFIRGELLERFEEDMALLQKYLRNIEKICPKEMEELRTRALPECLDVYEGNNGRFKNVILQICSYLDSPLSYAVRLELFYIGFLKDFSGEGEDFEHEFYTTLDSLVLENSSELVDQVLDKLRLDGNTKYLSTYIIEIERLIHAHLNTATL
jgi:hypothetical protein